MVGTTQWSESTGFRWAATRQLQLVSGKKECELSVARSSYFSREAGSRDFYTKSSEILVMLKDFKIPIGQTKYA